VKTTHIPVAFLVIASAFSVIGIGLAAMAFLTLWYGSGPSTLLMAVTAFAWALLAMVGSIVLARPGRSASGGPSAGSGRATAGAGSDDENMPPTSFGPGVEAQGTVSFTVADRLPSTFLLVAAIGLAVLTASLYAAGRATPIGALFSLAIALCIGSWARQARPPQPISSTSRVNNGGASGGS
jgi:hypothetical protein